MKARFCSNIKWMELLVVLTLIIFISPIVSAHLEENHLDQAKAFEHVLAIVARDFVIIAIFILFFSLVFIKIYGRNSVKALPKNILASLRNNVKWASIFTIMLIIIYVFATGIVSWYLFIPEKYSYYPTFFPIEDPDFFEPALVWRLSEHWLLSLGFEHSVNFAILLVLFVFNTALILDFKKKRHCLGGMTMGSSGILASFFGVFSCCAPTLMIALLGTGLALALEPYSGIFKIASSIFLISSLFLLNNKLSKRAS